MADQLAMEARNCLLGRMSCPDLALIRPFLKPVALKFRQRLQSPNRKIENAFFLERGLGSVVTVSNNGRYQAEIATVGREGMIGLAIVLGTDRSGHATLIHVAGEGQCIAADDLRYVMMKSRSLSALLIGYAHTFLMQVTQTALANACGKIEERLARWLLMAHDRIDGDELLLTHELLAAMLGVRRAGVTTALHELELRKLIGTARGSVFIVDREGLKKAANGFYSTIFSKP